MAGNRFPVVPEKLCKEYSKISKAVLMETLYDLSELHSLVMVDRSGWVLSQIEARKQANKKGEES